MNHHLRHLQERGGSGTTGNQSSLFFLLLFFFFWNAFTSYLVSPALHDLSRCIISRELIVLLCPHWLIGLAPFVIGYFSYGVVGIFALGLPTVALPYAITIYLQFRQERQRDNLATQGNNGPGDESAINLESQQALDEVLIIKKVIANPSTESSDQAKDEESYRIGHPKEDVLLPSKELCTICLDEYTEGDQLAWSRNPSCHHVFHRTCLEDWLNKMRKECPVCRSSYFDFHENDHTDANV